MFNWLFTLNNTEKIELFSMIASLITSIVAICISIKTLKQSNNAITESSRANILFYIDTLTGGQQFLTLKNFGHSVGKVVSVNITPELNYSKNPTMPDKPNPVLVNYSNILLAPNQCIKSWFPFSNYPDKELQIHIEYETLGKTYIEDYPIDLSYIKAIDYLQKDSFHTKDEKSALVDIGNTLRRLSERF